MITLRHHIISLAAVFLALAVGVVLGSGVLNDTMRSGISEGRAALQKQGSGSAQTSLFAFGFTAQPRAAVGGADDMDMDA